MAHRLPPASLATAVGILALGQGVFAAVWVATHVIRCILGLSAMDAVLYGWGRINAWGWCSPTKC